MSFVSLQAKSEREGARCKGSLGNLSDHARLFSAMNSIAIGLAVNWLDRLTRSVRHEVPSETPFIQYAGVREELNETQCFVAASLVPCLVPGVRIRAVMK
jgi:hypothetical protein